MSSQRAARQEQVEAWLTDGGVVLAASERAARSVMADYHAARRAEGRAAWRTPAICSWESWLRDEWQQRNVTGALLLNPLQEQSLWLRVIQRSRRDLLHPARLAEAAARAYRLLAAYAPEALHASARVGWVGEAAVFSSWIEDFEGRCRREELLSASRLSLELTEALRSDVGVEERPPLLLVGFDRVLETQAALLTAWGTWERLESAESAPIPQFQSAPDPTAEVAACANWLQERLAADPDAKLMVVATDLEARRGELERVFDGLALNFEFSMGVPLAQLGLARSAVLLLRWLHEPIGESELDWLIGSGHLAASAEEEIALAGAMRQIRRDGQERMEWEMADFAGHTAESKQETYGWARRSLSAQTLLASGPARQSPLMWVSVAERLLEALGWPGFRPLSSLGFQARDRWQSALEECGSLGFDGGRIEYEEFVAILADAVAGTIFAAESRDAAVQITGPAESAGQLAHGIWFLGADEESWPGHGQPDPLIPIGLQREAGMPHASSQADLALAHEATERILASADAVVFSFARQAAGVEVRPSRLVLQRVGAATEIAARADAERQDRTETFEDTTQLPFPLSEISGGAATLTSQSNCPFQAFASVRLAAEDFDPAEAGLNARQRGLLLHAVLHRAWAGGSQGGVRSLAELQAIPALKEFVSRIVNSVMSENFDPKFGRRRNSLPHRFPQRYLELEAERLTNLVTEWLEFERQRQPFTVAETEVKREITIAGLTLRLRLDRIDELPGGGRLVIDYKTGVVGPRAWEGERPDDVQLPIYATFAVSESLEGLVFAKVRPGETHFAGRVRNANGTLLAGLKGTTALVKNPLTDEELTRWRDQIEQLGEDFLAGRADADPKDPQKTCQTCHLHAVCRIRERVTLLEGEGTDEDDTGETDD